MKGKERCKILKEIRKTIAEKNDIELVISECKHQGDCLGTCPKCEAEVAYLEKELAKRRALGRAVAVAGLTAVTAVSGGCLARKPAASTAGTPMLSEQTEQITEQVELEGEITPDTEQLMGEPVEIQGDIEPLMGVVALPTEGDVVYYPSSEELAGLNGDEIWEQIRWMDRQSMRDRWSLISSEEDESGKPCDMFALDETRALRVSFDESGAPTDVTVIDLTGKS